VLDVQNIAMRHGNNLTFSCQGIKAVIEYWTSRGHEVIGFLPDYLFDRDRIEAELKKANEPVVDCENPEEKKVKNCRLPDDLDYLE
jgi:hypothetical protein